MKAIDYARILTGIAAAVLMPLTLNAQEIDPAKMAEVMEKYGTPGKEHEAFASWVGTWTTETTYWMVTGAPAMKMSGSAKFRILMKGRYLNEQFKSKCPEMGAFSGRGTMAYDRLTKEYVSTWIDTMSTGVMVSRGKASEDGKKIVLHSKMKDAMTMLDVQCRTVSHVGDPEKRKMEMFITYPGKPEHKLMEVTYEKQPEALQGAAVGAVIGGIIGEQKGERDEE